MIELKTKNAYSATTPQHLNLDVIPAAQTCKQSKLDAAGEKAKIQKTLIWKYIADAQDCTEGSSFSLK